MWVRQRVKVFASNIHPGYLCFERRTAGQDAHCNAISLSKLMKLQRGGLNKADKVLVALHYYQADGV